MGISITRATSHGRRRGPARRSTLIRPNRCTSTGPIPTRASTAGAVGLERVGRRWLRIGQPTRIDVPLADGDELPFWGGLKVVHLPGHTLGHCGFYSARHDVLFSGDLFASYFFNAHLPPAILNSAPELIPASFEKARQLSPRFIVPQHYDILDGELHRRRFRRTARETRASADASRRYLRQRLRVERVDPNALESRSKE